MKIANTFLAGLLLIGSLVPVSTVMAQDKVAAANGIIEDVPLDANTYCHEKFFQPDQDHTPGSQVIVDFYGPCSERPTGKDQAWQQRIYEGRHATVFEH